MYNKYRKFVVYAFAVPKFLVPQCQVKLTQGVLQS